MRSPLWPSDPTYPANLGQLPHPPPLFCRGRVDSIDARSVAVVGTRTPSRAGIQRSRSLATQLARGGVTVVSGLARGVDTAAHEASLDAGGRSIAVLGCGIDRVYPPENAGLAARLAEHGAVLADVPPDQPVCPPALRRRNSLIAGLSLATVVVEASARSGAWIAARAALRLDRPVFVTDLVDAQDWGRELLGHPGVHILAAGEGLLRLLSLLGREGKATGDLPAPVLEWAR